MLPPWLEWAQRTALLITALLYSAGYATVGLALILATVIAEGIIIRRLPWRRSPLDSLLLAFVTVFLISGLVSPHRATALGSLVLAGLTIYLTFGVLYRVFQRDEAFLSPFLWAWIAGGILAALWSIILSRLKGSPAFTPALGQNAIGTTLLVALILCLGVFVAARSQLRYVIAAGMPAVMAGLLLSYTRGAWLGAAAGVLLAFVLTGLRQKWRAAALILVVLGAAVAVAWPARSALIQEARTVSSLEANRGRLALFRAGVAIFADHLVIGTGLNTFSLVYQNYRKPDDPDRSPPFAHNILLNMAAEGGILGVAAFTAIIFYAVASGWKRYVTQHSSTRSVLAAAVLSAFAGMMIQQLFDGTVLSVHLGSGMWFLIAILVTRPAI